MAKVINKKRSTNVYRRNFTSAPSGRGRTSAALTRGSATASSASAGLYYRVPPVKAARSRVVLPDTASGITLHRPVVVSQGLIIDQQPMRRVLLGPLAPGWQLIQPLLLTFEQDEDGLYLVADDLFGVYGDGESEEQALDDYKVSLIDFFELASQDYDTIQSRALFSLLKRYIQAPST